MNERIIELVKQAGGHWNYGDWNLPNVVEFQETDIPKFVELIVKECTQFNYDFLESYREACEVNSKIKEHFGVEE